MPNFRDKLLQSFTEHQDALKRFFRRRLGNAVLAEDLTQETWIRAAGVDAASVSNPRAYLFQIASNLAIDHQRRLGRGIELEADDELFDLVADPKPSPESEALNRNEYAHVLRVLDSLPPRVRAVFILAKFEELSYSQIVKKLGISRSTVITSMMTAMSALEADLKLQKKLRDRPTGSPRPSS